MYCLAVNDSCVLRVLRSWKSLYRRYDNLIRLSVSWRILATQFSSPVSSACGYVVGMVSVGKEIGLSKVVGPGACCDSNKQNGSKFARRCTWGLYAYVRGCTCMSQFLQCSDKTCRRLVIVVLSNRLAYSFVYRGYVVVVRCFAPRKGQGDSKNVLTNCTRLSLKSCVTIQYDVIQLYKKLHAMCGAVVLDDCAALNRLLIMICHH